MSLIFCLFLFTWYTDVSVHTHSKNTRDAQHLHQCMHQCMLAATCEMKFNWTLVWRHGANPSWIYPRLQCMKNKQLYNYKLNILVYIKKMDLPQGCERQKTKQKKIAVLNGFVKLRVLKDITPRSIPPFCFITCLASISSMPLIAFSNLPPWTRKGKQFYAAHSNQ